jgi:hypothetical protein
MASYDYASGGFPTSPATNDTLTINGTSYIYDGSKWKVVGANGLTSSATAPSSPNVGDQWFDTTDGILFAYMTDGTDSDWIDISSANGLASSGGGGAMEFISQTKVTTAVSSVAFTSLSGYTRYLLKFSLTDASATATGGMRVKLYDNGSLISTASNYYKNSVRSWTSTGVSTNSNLTDSFFRCYWTNYDMASGEFTLDLTGTSPQFNGHTSEWNAAESEGIRTDFVGKLVDSYSVTAINGIYIYPQTSSFQNGCCFTLYGIKDS